MKTGQELYELYASIYDRNGVEVDRWEDLDEIEKNVWDQLAAELA